jgi:predicted NBD/HSP70 family sugar kinase
MSLTKKQKQNQAEILDKIYVKGPISRIDIANETGITPATVSSITSQLISEKLVEEIGEDSKTTGSGRRKILLDIQAHHSYFIGLELAEKFISLCLSDNKGEIIEEKVLWIQRDKSHEELTAENIIHELKLFMEENNNYEISGIGVALPGHYQLKDQQFLTNNPIWKKFDLNVLKDAFDIPVYFENNVKSMVLYERFFQNTRTDNNFIFFHIKRGIFSASIYEGELYAPNNQIVGEVGHTTIQMDGALCECGNRGCLQTFASEAWLIKKAQTIFDFIEDSFLTQLVTDREEITIETLLVAYKLGDKAVIELLQSAIKAISTSIINLTMSVDTRAVYVHGSIFNEDALVQLLNEYISKRVPLFEAEQPPSIQVVPYNEMNGALGACVLCIANMYANK